MEKSPKQTPPHGVPVAVNPNIKLVVFTIIILVGKLYLAMCPPG
jgi:hypothetical protein